VTTVGYALAILLELQMLLLRRSTVAATVVMAAWGLPDALVQTYAYWLINALFSPNSTPVVALYKLVQSAGWCAGYAILPQSRCPFLVQLLLTASACFFGTLLALLQLPSSGPDDDNATLDNNLAFLLDEDATTTTNSPLHEEAGGGPLCGTADNKSQVRDDR
jgi:hypothetical protein